MRSKDCPPKSASQRRHVLEDQGIDPASIPSLINPLGEEALAMKERVLRLEKELILRGGDLTFLAVPASTSRRGTNKKVAVTGAGRRRGGAPVRATAGASRRGAKGR